MRIGGDPRNELARTERVEVTDVLPCPDSSVRRGGWEEMDGEEGGDERQGRSGGGWTARER